jgi:hypothetical protein
MVESEGKVCLKLRKDYKKANYVHLSVKLAPAGRVDDVAFDGEPLTAVEESCLRERVAAWRLPKQKQACLYDGLLLQVPLPVVKLAPCKPSPMPTPAPKLENPFRLGLAIDANGYFFASPNGVVAPHQWDDDLSSELAKVRAAIPGRFTPDMLFVVVKRTATPEAWVEDLMAPLWRAGVRRVAIRIDDTLQRPAEGCSGTAKDVAAWRKLFRSLTPTDFQEVGGRQLKSSSTLSPRPPIVGRELDTLSLLCDVIPKTPRYLHNGLIADHCAKLSSCAGECAAELLAFSSADELSSLASCKDFEVVKPQCSPVHPPSCAHRWIRGRLLGAVAATAKATPPLAPELANRCRTAGLLPEPRAR